MDLRDDGLGNGMDHHHQIKTSLKERADIVYIVAKNLIEISLALPLSSACPYVVYPLRSQKV